MDNIIAIYGQTCALKTEVAAGALADHGLQARQPRGKGHDEAKVHRDPHRGRSPGVVPPGARHGDPAHGRVEREADDLRKRFMDAVLASRPNVFLVRLRAADDVREARWKTRKEEGGGRTRQLGESVRERDREDAGLRTKLYGAARKCGEARPRPRHHAAHGAVEVALQIWETFEAKSGIQAVTEQAGDGQGRGARHLPRAGDGKRPALQREADARSAATSPMIAAGRTSTCTSPRSPTARSSSPGRRWRSRSWPTASAASRRRRWSPRRTPLRGGPCDMISP